MLCLTALSVANAKKFTLVIDAGHGGKDAGAIGAISKEKDINLTVALAFGAMVERGCPDVRVIYTRKTDVFIPLMQRAQIANRNKADLFISVHTNSLPKGRIARGFETYTLGMHRADDNLDVAKRENSVILVEKNYKQTYRGFDPNSSESYIMFELIQGQNMEKSVQLAKYIQSNVCDEACRADKGVHQAGFLVLRETSMPSCLIELGFISTPDEERQLNDRGNVDKMARGLYKAFLNYRNKYDRSITAPFRIRGTVDEEPAKPVAKEEPVKVEKFTQTEEPKQAKEPVKAEGAKTEEPMKTEKQVKVAQTTKPAQPVFKVQIIACGSKLQAGASQLKGLEGCECYQDGGMYKYTYGASTDYNEIYRLRKQILDKFPQAFIIAFKNGERMNVNQAIAEFKSGRNIR